MNKKNHTKPHQRQPSTNVQQIINANDMVSVPQ